MPCVHVCIQSINVLMKIGSLSLSFQEKHSKHGELANCERRMVRGERWQSGGGERYFWRGVLEALSALLRPRGSSRLVSLWGLPATSPCPAFCSHMIWPGVQQLYAGCTEKGDGECCTWTGLQGPWLRQLHIHRTCLSSRLAWPGVPPRCDTSGVTHWMNFSPTTSPIVLRETVVTADTMEGCGPEEWIHPAKTRSWLEQGTKQQGQMESKPDKGQNNWCQFNSEPLTFQLSSTQIPILDQFQSWMGLGHLQSTQSWSSCCKSSRGGSLQVIQGRLSQDSHPGEVQSGQLIQTC